jgi:MFS family permease
MVGSGMMVPVLSLYAATFSVSSTLVGMLVTMFGIGRLCANLPSGYLGAALTSDFTHLVAWRFVQGVGSGMYMTVSLAALADMATSASRARLVGLYQAALQLGATIGPLIGGYIAEHFGLAAPFWALLVISIATAILGVVSYRDAPARVATMSGALGARRGLFTLPFLSISFVSGVSFFTRTACLFQLMPLMGAETFKLDVASIGIGIAISAAAILVVLPVSGLLIQRMGARWAVIMSMLGSAVGVALLAGGAHPAWFWASMALYGLAGGFNGPAVGAYTIEVLPRSKYGPGMGLQRTISDVGYVAGPVVVGFVSDHAGFGLPGGVWANVVLLVAATGLFALTNLAGPRRAG